MRSLLGLVVHYLRVEPRKKLGQLRLRLLRGRGRGGLRLGPFADPPYTHVASCEKGACPKGWVLHKWPSTLANFSKEYVCSM